ncbi:MAG TPA: GTPase HflX [Thermoanaerobaculia bacterium]|nr:GTPase HflX [Thermoanaerobaculia bacterium]
MAHSNGGRGGPERAIVAGLITRDGSRTVAEEHLEELAKLVEAAGGAVSAAVLAKRQAPDPAMYVGKGKAAEIAELARRHEATLVVFDDDLSPAQIRNLEKVIEIKVIDRSALILDIFARRARSRESRTQVELAQLKYLLPRLTRQWSHLSRQAGGIGTRGVGETQLEIDRRMIRTRISRLDEELTKIERNRAIQRKGRRSAFTVALVGYTNAGKSTLFNQLTRGSAVAVDKLFATLDARLHKSHFDAPRETVIIDTVGFIRKLPHHLVASFRSTMEEAVAADLVLHVIDGSHPQSDEQREVGEEVLHELGILADRVIEVYNKADRFAVGVGEQKKSRAVAVSALTGQGCDRLIAMIRERELAEGEVVRLEIPASESRILARLHELAQIEHQEADQDLLRIVAWIPDYARHQFEAFELPDLGGRIDDTGRKRSTEEAGVAGRST